MHDGMNLNDTEAAMRSKVLRKGLLMGVIKIY